MKDFRGEFSRDSEKDSRSYLTEEGQGNHTGKAHKKLFDINSEAVLKLLSEGLRGKNFRFDRGFGEDSGAYLT